MDDYESTWGTPVGQDCIDLCSSLPRWLGERLTFLGTHTSGVPISYLHSHADGDAAIGQWRSDLIRHGEALTKVGRAGAADADLDMTDEEIAALDLNAREAMVWVADNLQNLWD
jgi:hypothetical protein